MKYLEGLKTQVGIIALLEIVTMILLVALGLERYALILLGSLVVNLTLVFWILYTIQRHKQEQAMEVSRVLGKEAKGALDFGKVGVIIYNDQYEVTWGSAFLLSRDIDLEGRKVSTIFPDTEELFQGEVDSVETEMDGYVYEIVNHSEARVLYVKDITELDKTSKKYEDESLVVGLVHMDNYADVQAFEDESTMANVNLNLRQPIVDWAKQNSIIIRRLRSDRFFLVLNEDTYKKLLTSKFDILEKTRKAAQEIDVNITLSIAFARGHSELEVLDTTVNDLLELAQSRGGDQVAVKRVGDDVKYYGGKSEASATRSRVRVRVMAQAFKEAVMESNKIFLSGHKEMDFDCMGANLAISRLIQSYGKEVYIVSKSGGIEEQLQGAMKKYDKELQERHKFISDDEAVKMLKKNDLFIALDYHNPEHANAPKLLEKIERTVVLDHHRRGPDFIAKPLFVYLESSASSSCELISELIAYQPGRVDIGEAEATIMYLGILVDTNHFKMHTGFRTFEACAQLRKWGVNTSNAEELLNENYTEFESKINVLKYSEMYNDYIMISCVDDAKQLSRPLMSMSADRMLQVKEVEAAFVVARVSDTAVAISGRSRGEINVQVVMESLGGGGHFSAAATQVEGITTSELNEQLKEALHIYLKEDENNEGNIT